MTGVPDFVPYRADADVIAIGIGLRERTLPRRRWTHEAHLTAAVWCLNSLGESEALRTMPVLIRAYNEATGVPNTDTSGFHETITTAFLRAASASLSGQPDVPLFVACNQLILSPVGKSDYLLSYWSRPCLFSVEARRRWVDADLKQFPFEGG